MNKKDWKIVIGALIGAFLVDLLSKVAALAALGNNSYNLGPVGLSVRKGTHFLLTQLHIFEYVTTMASFGFSSFFLFLFFVLNLVIVKKLLDFRIAIALFTAGMLGGSADMVFQGSTISWIVFFGRHISLADLYIVVGTVLTLYYSIKYRSIIFHKNNMRSKIFIERDQYIFCFYVLCSYLIFIGAYCLFSLIFIKMIVGLMAGGQYTNLESKMEKVFLTLYFILSFAFFIVMTMFTVYVSNKVYGPVYAFKKYIRDVLLLNGNVRSFRLRKGDHFEDLSDLADQLIDKYRRGAAEKKE